MDVFKRVSEVEAVNLIKKGKRPDKLVKKQSDGMPAQHLDKKKSSGGGKKKQQKRDDSNLEEAKSQAMEAACPFREQQIAARLTESSQSGELTPGVDEVMLECLSEFLVEPVPQ